MTAPKRDPAAACSTSLGEARARSREPSSTFPPLALAACHASLRFQQRLLFDSTLPVQTLPAGDAGAASAARPVLEQAALRLPGAAPSRHAGRERSWYEAAVHHAEAHRYARSEPVPRGGLRPLQQALYGLLQDARAEALACTALPGLRALWLSFHPAAEDCQGSAERRLQGLARALLDPSGAVVDRWVGSALARFQSACRGGGDLAHLDSQVLRELASVLGNELGQMRLAFDSRTLEVLPDYRDDNRHLWWEEEVEVPLDSMPSTEDGVPAAPLAAIARPELESVSWVPEWGSPDRSATSALVPHPAGAGSWGGSGCAGGDARRPAARAQHPPARTARARRRGMQTLAPPGPWR